MLFDNRVDAGRKLALKVDHYLCHLPKAMRDSELVVVALPREGAPVGLQ